MNVRVMGMIMKSFTSRKIELIYVNIVKTGMMSRQRKREKLVYGLHNLMEANRRLSFLFFYLIKIYNELR